jgi:EpsI family protein
MTPVLTRQVLVLILMLASSAAALYWQPTASLADERPPIDLAKMVPSQFKNWQEQLNLAVQIIDPEQQATIAKIYTQTLTRNYVDTNGNRIMLSIAYGKSQSDNLQLHKPEICYPAQGFTLDKVERLSLNLLNKPISITRMETHLGQRFEPVTYWTVVGDFVTTTGINKKLTEMRYGMQGKIPDGMLVRVSSIDRDTAKAFAIQAEFATAMVAAISSENRSRFSGMVIPAGLSTTVVRP